MNERERWIVYPLLFLALGAGLRDKLFDMTSSKRIVCQELLVVGDERPGRQPVPVIRIGAAQESSASATPLGVIEVVGDIRARSVFADNYVYRGISFGPTFLQAMPGISPADWLRALQQSAEAMQRRSESSRPTAEDGAADGEISNGPPNE